MRRVFLVIFSLLFAGSANAGIIERLNQVTATYESRVGVAFIDLHGTLEAEINGRRQFPSASVAKVLVMACAYDLKEKGKLDLGYKIKLRKEDKSDNTATKMVVDAIGLPQIERYLLNVGLIGTRISDPTMLKEPPALDNNLTTPHDMAVLIKKIYLADGFSREDSKDMLSFMKRQRYRWGIWRGVPPGTVVADKTGNLEGILNDAGVVYTKKGNYVLSVFTYGFKKQRDARLLINEISKAVYEEYTGEKVIIPQKTGKKRGVYKKKAPRKRRRR